MKKLALMFPGQGSQYPGMGARLYKQSTIVQEVFKEANDVIGKDVFKLCVEGSMEDLAAPNINHPTIFTLSVAYFKFYLSQPGLNPPPNFLIGHSLGEYAALTCAGVFSFADGLRMVCERGELLSQFVNTPNRTIAVTGLHLEQVESIMYGTEPNEATIACYNSTKQFTLSGSEPYISRIATACEHQGGHVSELKIKVPVHTPALKDLSQTFKEKVTKYEFRMPQYEVLSNITGAPFRTKEEIIESRHLQLTSPVQWSKAIAYLLSKSVHYFIELGPKKGLSQLVASSQGEGPEAFSFDDDGEAGKFQDVIRENAYDLYTTVTKCLTISATTRNHNNDIESYNTQVPALYSRIKALDAQLKNQKRLPTAKEITEALGDLTSILEMKKTDSEVIKEYISEAIMETGAYHLITNKI